MLIVTWTVDEGHASEQGAHPRAGFGHWLEALHEELRHHLPDDAPRLSRPGAWSPRNVLDDTDRRADGHALQVGLAHVPGRSQTANATVWEQIIQDCAPSWVITTGTGGGIGPTCEVGDVIVSRFVTFDCHKMFASLNGETFACSESAPTSQFQMAESLFQANAHLLPGDNTRAPQIVSSTSADTGILTTDFFGFDDSTNTFGLQGKGDLSEMGDAVLGKVCQQLGQDAPPYVIVRNVSDPQIAAAGLTLAQQETLAGQIYMGYGLWSTICSAIVCWAIVAALP